jgi:hypothetical protein
LQEITLLASKNINLFSYLPGARMGLSKQPVKKQSAPERKDPRLNHALAGLIGQTMCRNLFDYLSEDGIL